MGTWGLLQIVFNIFLGLGLFVLAMRIGRQPKDDPRLSRGLQLLQAKIAVLEDLSDRTEVQVSQMTALLEQKARDVQAKIELADRHVQLVRSAMDRSLEVAQIFQDKIPHQEIIERKNTLKYLQAARLAHQGKSVEEIAAIVELPKGEIEFITKVNRDQLMFSEAQLPDWAKEGDPSLGLTNDTDGEEDEVTGLARDSAAVSAARPAPAPEMTASAVKASAMGASAMAGSAMRAEEASGASQNTSDDNRRRAVIETVQRSQLESQQELLENLQAVQRELEEAIRSEIATRDYSDVFNVPKPPTASLARLGEAFRQACQLGLGNGSDDMGSSPLLDISPTELEEIKRSARGSGLTIGASTLGGVASSEKKAMQTAAQAATQPATQTATRTVTSAHSQPTMIPPGAAQMASGTTGQGRVLNGRTAGRDDVSIKKVEFRRISPEERGV